MEKKKRVKSMKRGENVASASVDLLLFIEASAQHKDACFWNSFQTGAECAPLGAEGRRTEIMGGAAASL